MPALDADVEVEWWMQDEFRMTPPIYWSFSGFPFGFSGFFIANH